MTIYTLTTGVNHITGTPGSDTFIGTYNGAATDTFNVSDILIGGGIVNNTLILQTNHTSAITPGDALWGGVKNIQNIIIDGGVGAQTITTGTLFERAFSAHPLNLKTNSTAGAVTIDMSTFTGVTQLVVTSTDGAETITTGSAHDTVVAASWAGAQTITGAGLTSVTACSGAGAQTIYGNNLTNVYASSVAGAQTISGAHITTLQAYSTSGEQIITVGAGTNHITAVSAAPVNFITDQGGNDTINVGTSTGNYTITVGKGNAVITGGSGNEMITTGPGNDTINCGSGNNTITTGPGNDIINGGSGNDTIITGAGNDTINGGGGVNNITVGIGRHNFVFTSTTGVDDITGFTVIHDKLTFNHLDFPSLKSLTAANLEIGSAAVTAAQHLIYNPTTGEVSYAAQGSAGPAVEVALIGVHLNLSIANFAVI